MSEMNLKQTLQDGSQHEKTFKAEIIVVMLQFNIGSRSAGEKGTSVAETKPQWPPSFNKIKIDKFGLVTIGFNTTMIQTSKESLDHTAIKI